jgi:hypothetical protein
MPLSASPMTNGDRHQYFARRIGIVPLVTGRRYCFCLRSFLGKACVRRASLAYFGETGHRRGTPVANVRGYSSPQCPGHRGKTLQSLGGHRTGPTPKQCGMVSRGPGTGRRSIGLFALFAHFWHFFADAMELVTAPPALLPPDVRGPEGSGIAASWLAGICGAGDLGEHGFVVAGNRCTGTLDSGEKSSTGGPDGGTAIRVTRGKGTRIDRKVRASRSQLLQAAS